MSHCTSCGGVIGRDCFNPVECAQITHTAMSMWRIAGADLSEKR
jgi:hypothetical protein